MKSMSTPSSPRSLRLEATSSSGTVSAPERSASELLPPELLDRLASLDLVEEEDTLSQLRLQLGQLEGVAGDVPWEDFEEYEKLKQEEQDVDDMHHHRVDTSDADTTGKNEYVNPLA